MLEPLGRMLIALWAHDVSRLFSFIIGTYLVFGFLLINSTNPKVRTFVSSVPGALTSLGILGTFVGVFLGLLDFDIRTINKSVPILLEGLKVAFGTSILGLTSALVFRLVSPLLSRYGTETEDATIEDIVEQLSQLDKKFAEANETALRGFEAITYALTDDRDTNIVGQLQRLRSNVSDLDSSVRNGFEAQINEFKSFAEHMSEAFSKAIIEELQAVIREFNEKISEQFGDNFKQLNEAVGRLVDWQNEYRQQMEELKTAFENAVAGIEISQRALSEIEASASSIPQHMEAMETANNALNAQIEKIEENLGAFAEMREKAVNAFPEIEKNIENITLNLSSTVEHQTEVVREISDNCEALIANQKASGEELLNGFNEMRASTVETVDSLREGVTEIAASLSQHIEQTSETLKSEMEKVSQDMSTSVRSIAEEMQNHAQDSVAEQKAAQREMLDGLQTSFNETISNATSRMNDAIVQLDDAMQGEIESVIRAMAENLSGITEKFVEDYAPLLETTRRVVELSERAGRDE